MEMASNSAQKIGNLFSIYKKLKKREIRAIEKEVNAKPAPAIGATVDAECGQWIVAVTMPGEENVASGHLIGRGFGVYQPRIPKVYLRKGGRKVEIMRPMFPTYLFVYVWGAKEHVRRICACTGVSRVLMLDADTPAIVPWSKLDEIMVQENLENPMILRLDEVNGRRRKRKRHNKKAKRRHAAEDHANGEPFVMTTKTWGFSKSMGTWDDPETEQRVSALHKALGLAA